MPRAALLQAGIAVGAGDPADLPECHSPTRGNFGKAHLNIDANVMDCKSCHDRMRRKTQKFFKANVHAPFAARSCEECHIP